jgi:hypothetical protein
MIKRAFRPIAITLSLLLVAAVPVQAGPVTLADVIQVISGNPRYGGQAPAVQLRQATQEDKTQRSNSRSTSSNSSSSQEQGGGDVSTQQDPPSSNNPQEVQAQTEEVTEIGITDCECGELPDEIVEIPGRRSFLPFLPLIGLVCVTGICTPGEEPTPTPTSTPTPTPTPTPIPEPATLFLFGSGLAALGASARRRRARAKLAQQSDITEG